jgi:lipopolysaccharide biosynthesis glycosyltransferase
MTGMKIFIGWDSRFPEPADVLRHSLIRHASIPLQISYLNLAELGMCRQHDPLASTEFTYSRFLVPHLCGFEGKAVFMDNDMVCLGDIRELDDLDMQDLALRVVKHDYTPAATLKMNGVKQTSYPRKNWSSLMIMNCAKLDLWTKQVVETQTGAYLHRFQDIPDNLIGDIPESWNMLDRADDATRMIHYTSGGPWFEECRDHAFADLWYQARDEARQADGQRSRKRDAA